MIDFYNKMFDRLETSEPKIKKLMIMPDADQGKIECSSAALNELIDAAVTFSDPEIGLQEIELEQFTPSSLG